MAVDLNEIPSYSSQMSKQVGGKAPKVPRINIAEMLKPQENAVTETPAGETKTDDTSSLAKAQEETRKTQAALEAAEAPAREAAEAKKKADEEAAAKVEKPVFEGLEEIGEVSDLLGTEKAEEDKGKGKGKEANMGELRRLREAAEAKVTELQSRLDTIEGTYKTQIEELNAKLEQTAFEKSPKFHKKYQEPYEKAMGDLKAFVKDFEEEESVITTAMGLKGKERIAFIDEKFGGGAAAAEMLHLVNAADLQNANLTKAVTEYKATKAELAASEVTDEKQEQEVLLKRFDSTVTSLSSKLSYFKKIDGDDEHNAEVDSRIAHAKAIITGEASPEDVVLAPFLSVVCRAAIKRANDLAKELQKYKARVKEDVELEPGIHRGTSDAVKSVAKGKPMNARSAIMSALND